MISALVNDPIHADYIRKKSSQTLIALLKLYQPGQYVPAYEILKKSVEKNLKFVTIDLGKIGRTIQEKLL